MKDLLLGVLLGILLTMLPSWLEKHKMDNYIDMAMVLVVVGIILLLSWRMMLKLISKRFPKFYIWINEFNASTPITNEYRKKAYRKNDGKDDSRHHD